MADQKAPSDAEVTRPGAQDAADSGGVAAATTTEGAEAPPWWRPPGGLFPNREIWAQRVLAFSGAFYQTAVKLPLLVAFFVLVVLLIQNLRERSTAIEPISVPKALAESGYTPEVAGQRLRDALTQFASAADTSIRRPDITLHNEVPKIVVPTVGLSLDAIASSIRMFFGRAGRRSIAGEFIVRDKLLWLRLRIDGRELYNSSNGVDPERPDDLLADAAAKVLEEIQPYFLAASLRQVDPDRALEIAGRIIARRPATDESVPWALNLSGIIYWDRKQFQRAIDTFRKAVELNPRWANLHTNLGLILNQWGNREEAIAAFKTAAALDPNFAWPVYNLGVLAYEESKFSEAEAYYRKTIEVDPDHGWGRGNLALTLLVQSKLDEALMQYRKAIQLDPENHLIYDGLGVVLREQGRHDEAVPLFRKAIELSRNYLDAYSNLGFSLEQQGKLDEAIAEYRNALALDSNNVPALNALGYSLHRQGKYDEAIAQYSHALEIQPRFVQARLNWASALQQQGKYQEAIAHHREVLKIDPHNKSALDAIELLSRMPAEAAAKSGQ